VKESWQLMTIRGIPLLVHPSWFLILTLATMGFQDQYSRIDTGSGGVTTNWLLGLITALLLFVSVLLHELGHSFAALRQGVKVRSITLFLLGGVARAERECSTALGSLIVAAAGPLVSLILAAVLLGSAHAADRASPLLGRMVAQLGLLNLVLALFNLLPGLPLDGGLILKALVWHWTGSQRRGTQVAAASGRFLALLAIALGSLLFLRGGSIGGLWLVLLGWFGLGASRQQTQVLALQKALTELKVQDAASRRFRVLEQDRTLRDLSRLRLHDGDGPADWVLVCHQGRWKGYVTDDPLKELPVQRWDTDRLVDHMQPLSDLSAISAQAPLWEAALALEKAHGGRLLVMGAAKLPEGTLERFELSEKVLGRIGLKLSAPLIKAARQSNAYPLGLSLAQVAHGMVASGLVSSQGGPQGAPP